MEATRPVPGLKHATVSGVKWVGSAGLVRQVVIVVSGLLIARWIGPGPAGVVALASSFMNFANLFKDAGTTAALMRADRPSPRLISSLFWVNALLALALALALAAVAWPLSRALDAPLLASILPLLGLVLVLSGASAVHAVLLEREMSYRAVGLIEVISALAGAVVGLFGARAGWSHWSLVGQALAQALVAAAGAWIASAYRPGWVLDAREVRGVLSFSASLTGSNALNYVQRNADNVVVQHALGTVATGLYTRAYLALVQPLQQVTAVLGRVAHPVLLRVRDDPERFASAWLRLVGAMAAASFPICLGVAAVAPEFTRGVLGPEWEPIIPLLRVFACMGLVQSLMTMSGPAVQVLGRSDLMLRHALVMTPLLVTAFLVGVRWGLLGLTLANALAATFSGLVFVAFTLRLTRLSWSRLWAAIGRPLIVSVVSCGSVAATGPWLPQAWPELARLAVLVAEGVASYVALSLAFNGAQARELMALLRPAPAAGPGESSG